MSIQRGAARAISFDYGHVLGGLDVDELERRLFELGRAARPCAGLMRDALSAAFSAHDLVIAAGHGHEAAWRALMKKLVLVGTGDARDLDETVDALWRAQPTRNLWRHVPAEAHALLADLSALEIPMVVTSNSEGRAEALLTEIGIAQHFVAILDSGALGFGKPDPRMFHLAATRLSVPISAMVHVGDSEHADVLGAKRAGALTVRFDGFVPAAADAPTAADARSATFTGLRAILAEALDCAL